MLCPQNKGTENQKIYITHVIVCYKIKSIIQLDPIYEQSPNLYILLLNP